MTDVDVTPHKQNEVNTHEFAPGHAQKSSIDLSLELERELDALESTASDPLPLDPEVLSSLVSQLRRSVAELSLTRDDLVRSLGDARSRNAELRHSLDQAEEREKELQRKVDKLEEQTTADRDTINLLRQKVEESRRGLMRLQTEHRRSSSVVQPLTLDLSKPGSTAKGSSRPTSGNGTLAARLTGGPSPSPNARGHRRFSSIAGTSGQEINFGSEDLSPVSEAPARPLRKLNRLSRITGGELEVPKTAPLPNQEIDDLAESLRTARQEIDQLKTRLAEAEEAREASDSCAKALREFIEHHKIGEDDEGQPSQQTPVQPLPERKISGGWGGITGKLWRADSTNNNKSDDQVSLKAPSIAASQRSGSMSPRASMSAPRSPPPTTRGLFGLNFLSPSKPVNHQQDAMFNGSDTSSDGRRSMSPTAQVGTLPETASLSEARPAS